MATIDDDWLNFLDDNYEEKNINAGKINDKPNFISQNKSLIVTILPTNYFTFTKINLFFKSPNFIFFLQISPHLLLLCREAIK